MRHPIQKIAGLAIPLRGDDIDTDQIIPARHLTCITFDGLEAHVFGDERMLARARNHLHPFDDPRFAGAGILLVNANFGCGSSREHAPQALRRHGIRAIVGESFGEIFAGNCVALGIACVQLPAEAMRQLQGRCEVRSDTTLQIDLATMTLALPDTMLAIDMRSGPRRQLLNGDWDSLSMLLQAGDETRARLAILHSQP
ncbi:3-isopropylmalate dehydratase small subunit [Cupriavidus oxalaticus]|jgi:3-isopropylmalate/(R)-2-methylmalate dehydratase small subunit|uniref:3-isopropylmalate dehydratase n=1 Tax=Cupriavidus oxalaticus TaxID=96344 RepID=A0A5P3VB50_9BURK|nr:3-isopropylmalate dehydratase small subunit [Cupriavidus oxalaticus]QEZ43490.1 3-isopropylmalate dehydratase small subunit [Cupriavidus oxalaticus]